MSVSPSPCRPAPHLQLVQALRPNERQRHLVGAVVLAVEVEQRRAGAAAAIFEAGPIASEKAVVRVAGDAARGTEELLLAPPVALVAGVGEQGGKLPSVF